MDSTKYNHKIQFMVSNKSYMFRHQSAKICRSSYLPWTVLYRVHLLVTILNIRKCTVWITQNLYMYCTHVIIFEYGHFHSASMFSKEMSSWKNAYSRESLHELHSLHGCPWLSWHIGSMVTGRTSVTQLTWHTAGTRPQNFTNHGLSAHYGIRTLYTGFCKIMLVLCTISMHMHKTVSRGSVKKRVKEGGC
jgi:hypothetical protein